LIFWITIVGGLFLLFLIGMAVTAASEERNVDDNLGLAMPASALLIFIAGILIVASISGAAASDPAHRTNLEEKAYAVAESSTPVYENGTLRFTYIEDGKLFPFDQPVDRFPVTLERPKTITVTKYDIYDPQVLPWNIDSVTEVKVSK
jgi:hypothetical protein